MPAVPPAAAFETTQWSLVLEARGSGASGRAALEALCRTYWPPVYSYLRRRGHSSADAEDLTQGFFLHLIEGGFLDRPDPERGRFRGYLVGALRHFLASHFEREAAWKRGGQARFVEWSSLEAEREFEQVDLEGVDPGTAYEKSWALTLLGRALARLEAEQVAAGRRHIFIVLRPYLGTPPTRGDYERAAHDLGATRTTVAVWVHRLAQRYAELVKLEVAATVQDPAEVRAEMRHLLAALRA